MTPDLSQIRRVKSDDSKFNLATNHSISVAMNPDEGFRRSSASVVNIRLFEDFFQTMARERFGREKGAVAAV